jgi:hypothetical protein
MSEPKQRHGCLTAFLVVLITGSIFSLGSYLYDILSGSYQSYISELQIPLYSFILTLVLLFLNILWLIAIYKWKKWGFWAFVITGVASIIISIIYRPTFTSLVQSFLINVIGIGMLYGVLHIGKENKGWPQLE